MKDEYDFSNAEQGRFFVPEDAIEFPVYLDADVLHDLRARSMTARQDVQTLVNDLLRQAIGGVGRAAGG